MPDINRFHPDGLTLGEFKDDAIELLNNNDIFKGLVREIRREFPYDNVKEYIIKRVKANIRTTYKFYKANHRWNINNHMTDKEKAVQEGNSWGPSMGWVLYTCIEDMKIFYVASMLKIGKRPYMIEI